MEGASEGGGPREGSFRTTRFLWDDCAGGSSHCNFSYRVYNARHFFTIANMKTAKLRKRHGHLEFPEFPRSVGLEVCRQMHLFLLLTLSSAIFIHGNDSPSHSFTVEECASVSRKSWNASSGVTNEFSIKLRRTRLPLLDSFWSASSLRDATGDTWWDSLMSLRFLWSDIKIHVKNFD